MKACLTLKVDVNTISDDGYWSALNIAIHVKSPELLEILLRERNINPNLVMNHKNKGGIPDRWTALMFACWAGNHVMVERLVKEAECDINMRGLGNNTALTFAAGLERGYYSNRIPQYKMC